MEITVPSESYDSTVQFSVSSAPIKEHSFGEDFNPITPMITIDNGGSYSKEFIEVTIPVTIPEGHFAMGFIYDDDTRQLEGLPLVDLAADSITIAARHFSSFTVSSIDQSKLQEDIDSGKSLAYPR